VKIDQQDHFPATVLAVVGEMTQLQTLSFKGYVDENGESFQGKGLNTIQIFSLSCFKVTGVFPILVLNLNVCLGYLLPCLN